MMQRAYLEKQSLRAALLLIFFILFALDADAKPRKPRKAPKSFSLKKFATPSGSLRLGYFQRDKQSDDTGFLASSAWLNIKTKRVFNVGLFLDAKLQASNLTRTKNSYGDLREFYSFGNLHKFDLKVGRQIIVWGRADKLNPTDSLSVRDHTLLVTNDEDQRTGLFSVQQSYSFGDNRIIGIWQPEWRPTKFPTPALPAGVTLRTKRPDVTNEQFAVKFDHSGGALDYSLSVYSGLDKTPDLAVEPGGGLDVLFAYHQIQVYGADMAFNLGELAFRGELAYTKTEDKAGDDGTIKNPFLYGVFGGEKFFGENWNLNVQYLFRHIQDWVSPDSIADPTTQLLAEQVELLANQQQSTQHGFAVKLSNRAFDQTLESELTYVTWIEQGDFLLRPKFTYSVNDHWKAILGGELYGGPLDSYLGRLRGYSSGFAELRYYF